MIDYSFLKELKPDDLVLMKNNYDNEYIAKVLKVGKTFIEIQNNKYSIDDGYPKPRERWFTGYSIKKLATEEDFIRVTFKRDVTSVLAFFVEQIKKEDINEEILDYLKIIKTKILKNRENK